MCLTCLHFCVRSMGNVAKQPLDVGMKDLLNRTNSLPERKYRMESSL